MLQSRDQRLPGLRRRFQFAASPGYEVEAGELDDKLTCSKPIREPLLTQPFYATPVATSQARVFYLRSGSGEDPGSLWSREPPDFRGNSNCRLFTT